MIKDAKVFRYRVNVPPIPDGATNVHCIVRIQGHEPLVIQQQQFPDPFYLDFYAGQAVKIELCHTPAGGGLSTKRASLTVGITLPEGDLGLSMVEVDPPEEGGFASQATDDGVVESTAGIEPTSETEMQNQSQSQAPSPSVVDGLEIPASPSGAPGVTEEIPTHPPQRTATGQPHTSHLRPPPE